MLIKNRILLMHEESCFFIKEKMKNDLGNAESYAQTIQFRRNGNYLKLLLPPVSMTTVKL